jgi:hypothetical protein
VIALARRARWRAALMREQAESMRATLDELAVAVQAQVDRVREQRS